MIILMHIQIFVLVIRNLKQPNQYVININGDININKVENWKKYYCDICNCELNGENEYNSHMKSNKHKKKKDNLRKKEKRGKRKVEGGKRIVKSE